MSSLEGDIYRILLVMDPVGSQECRRNTDTHRALKTVTLGCYPLWGHMPELQRKCIPSGCPVYRLTHIHHSLWRRPPSPTPLLLRPLLKDLRIDFGGHSPAIFDSSLFNSDLPSLCTLHLAEVALMSKIPSFIPELEALNVSELADMAEGHASKGA